MALALALLLPAVGCSSKAIVFGKVEYQGQPLPGGWVNFVTAEGMPGGSSRIDPKDGSYRIEGALPGLLRVSVEPYREPDIPPGAGPGGVHYGPPPGVLPEGVDPNVFDPRAHAAASGARPVEIPAKYLRADQSGIEVTVKGGTQEFNINLDGPPGSASPGTP
jgi:hypothetical protein